ncbi:transmembrane protein 181 [Folsomia candida]|uniref:transmembrane protein 181 n=1 Tax=Folsomia candida TaxID=158441 RepID=UPI000B8FB259|nr:transmembrane protein 181 [Folsomia candida]
MESGNTLGYSYYMPQGGIPNRLKKMFDFNCCELFGVFNRYLAPAYHHDRCERSVKMKLYTLHKREFVIIILGFFVAIALVTFIGLVGPPITWETEIQGMTLVNESELAKGPFGLKSPLLTTYHQQLWIIAGIETQNQDDEAFEKTFEIFIDLFGIENGKVVKILNHSTRRFRRLECRGGGACEPFTVLHLTFIDFAKYFIVVRFSDLENINQRYHIKNVRFHFKTYSPSFTQLEMSFRFIYAVACFSITCWFMYSLRRFIMTDWSIEQRWISVLLPLLFLYNNPVFPLMFLVNSTFTSMMDALFQVTFLSGLCFFWLSTYHGLRQVERRMLTFYLPKVILVGSLWLSAIILASWQKLNTAKDPTFSYILDTDNFNNLKNVFIVSGVIYLVYLLFLILKAYSELRSMPYFDLRLKFLTGLLLIVVKMILTITYLRFGMDILEDHFVADLSTKYNSSAEFMAFYGTLNFYIFTMAYVYSPSSSAVLNSSSQITKDNPSFSMVNDSDDDVLYGSDEEDTKAPLNKHASTNHNDDSD